MRRFIKTTLGKLLSNAVAVSLIIPYIVAFATPRAEAQLQELPQWAVLDLVDKTGQAPPTFGAEAADAIRNELVKTGKYDVFPPEQINRAYKTLNLVPPVTQLISLLRLGAELKANTIVTSELHLFRFVRQGNLRRADLMVTMKVLDVASGIYVNGSSVIAHSTYRPLDTPDNVLLLDAMQTAAAELVRNVTSKELPFGTILNTYEGVAFVNRGTRSGFKPGQELIVLRGREQVATAIVSEVEPDSSKIKILTSSKGVQPGDKVRAIFTEPPIKLAWPKGDTTTPKFEKKNMPGKNSGLYTVALVLGLVAVALLNSSGDQNAASKVIAQAMTDSTGEPRIEISWRPDLFSKGTDRRVEWWVWRNDVTGFPVIVTRGSVITWVDDDKDRTPPYANDNAFLYGVPGGTTCDVTALPDPNDTNSAPGIVSGVPYTYQVSLIYRVLGIELPNANQDNDWCYFTSSKKTAVGTATAYNVTNVLNTPTANEEVTGPITFNFNAVGTALAPGVVIEYVLQISDSPTFTRKTDLAKFRRNDVGSVLTVGPIDLSGYYPSSSELYWRVGVKNVADNPGPKPDAYTKERYVFSIPRRLVRL